MQLDRDSVRQAIRAKVIALARALNIDASRLRDDDIIPATGYLDSTAILELVVWYETTYELPLEQEEINIDNLGSIDAMTEFLLHRKGIGTG
ncbi:MAG TPA: acyl carrier protein [Casimicrobiaceae bacterium]|nr:acyl carrier protein [Casimicrobiaceae bacterium]